MTRSESLTEWVRSKHDGQLIKHINEPYFNHLKFVADLAANFTPLGYEVGICHDLLEKTIVTATEIHNALISFGYDYDEAETIIQQIIELTNVFTKAAYPSLSKSSRKQNEAERLITISPGAQTVKYSDFIYNTNWILKYEPQKAKKYLQTKLSLLSKMSNGNIELYNKLLQLINNALIEP